MPNWGFKGHRGHLGALTIAANLEGQVRSIVWPNSAKPNDSKDLRNIFQ